MAMNDVNSWSTVSSQAIHTRKPRLVSTYADISFFRSYFMPGYTQSPSSKTHAPYALWLWSHALILSPLPKHWTSAVISQDGSLVACIRDSLRTGFFVLNDTGDPFISLLPQTPRRRNGVCHHVALVTALSDSRLVFYAFPSASHTMIPHIHTRIISKLIQFITL